MKICSKCKIKKDLSEFAYDNLAKSNKINWELNSIEEKETILTTLSYE